MYNWWGKKSKTSYVIISGNTIISIPFRIWIQTTIDIVEN